MNQRTPPTPPRPLETVLRRYQHQQPDWYDRALCAQTDPAPFFPEQGGSTRPAKRICNDCEVRAECLEHALTHNEQFGIWGGMSEQERHQLRREQPAAGIPAGRAA